MILCFGASLTAQIGLGGYVAQLKKIGLDVFPAGYGGYQLEHAHLVVKDLPLCGIETVIVEWFSPVKTYDDQEIRLYLGSMLYKLQQRKKTNLLCVLLPNRKKSSSAYFQKLIEYFTTFGVQFLNLESVPYESQDLKEDGLHTLPPGAEKYAAEIFKKLNEDLKIPLLPSPPEDYLTVKELEFRAVAELGQEIRVESKDKSHVLGILLVVGPKSGYIKMNGNLIQLWDKWSGRNRLTIKYNFFTPCIFKPIDLDFDKTSSALQPKWGPVNLEIRKIYYFGSDISVKVVNSRPEIKEIVYV